MTFAGPQGHDIELFTQASGLIRIENVRVWENSPETAKRLGEKYGSTLATNIKQGDAFALCRANSEKKFFPFHVINLDYTSGAFHVDSPRWLPTKLDTLQSLIASQKEHATSFLLLFAVAATADVDSEMGKGFIHKAAFDLAKRLGKPEALFNLTRDLEGTYPQILATVIPCVIVRMGCEHSFDTRCVGKAVYRPYRSRRTVILSFVFDFQFERVPLTLSELQCLSASDGNIEGRQREACTVPLVDVNRRLRGQLSAK